VARKTGKQVEVESVVDPGLIGGLYVRVDEYMMEYTVRSQLADLKSGIKGALQQYLNG
jgi:F0F1-type ATP synthase delta subunit